MTSNNELSFFIIIVELTYVKEINLGFSQAGFQ